MQHFGVCVPDCCIMGMTTATLHSMTQIDFNAPRWTLIPETAFEIDERRNSHDWVVMRERGGREVRVKFAVSAGVTRLIGLRLDDGNAISSRQLREVRISAMESAFARYMSATSRDLKHLETQVLAEYEDLATDASAGEHEDLHDTVSVVESMRTSHDRWSSAIDVGSRDALRSRGRGASPPTDDELTAFLKVYRKELLRGRGAIKRTAETVGMERTTVYRWIERCKQKQLLPGEGGSV